MKSTDYPVLLIYSKEDEAWLARVDLLPGCVADGKTQEDALANAKAAIEDWIAVCKELNRPVPKPLDIQEIEDFQLKALEHQGQQIQQLIQQAVTQVINQMQATAPNPTLRLAGGEMVFSGRGHESPYPVVASFSGKI